MDIFLKEKRKKKGYNLKTVSEKSGIDTGLLSKYESGQRIPSKKHLELLQIVYEIDDEEIKKEFFIKKISDLLKDENYGFSILHETEKRIRESLDQSLTNDFRVPSSFLDEIKKLDEMSGTWAGMKQMHPQNAAIAEQELVLRLLQSWCLDFNVEILWKELVDLQQFGKVNTKWTIDQWSQIKQLMVTVEKILKWSKNQDLDEELIKKIYFELHKSEVSFPLEIFRKRDNPAFLNIQNLPPAELCEYSLNSFIRLYNSEKEQLHILLLASELAVRIINLHPFEKYNPLMLRLMIGFLLHKKGFYLMQFDFRTLYNSRRNYDEGQWRLLVLKEIITEQKKSLSFLLKYGDRR